MVQTTCRTRQRAGYGQACWLVFILLVMTGCAGGTQRQQAAWPGAISSRDLVGHGCAEQAAELALVEESGGAIVPVDRNRFFLAWFPPGWERRPDRRLVVSLHGKGGCAERMFAFWHRNTPLHDFAFLALQYAETGTDNRLRFDSSQEVYSLLAKSLDLVAARYPLDGVPVVLHGFSKGSAMVFELAAMDRAPDGRGLFRAFIADSGTVFPDHQGRLSPLLQALEPTGYAGARFWLYCGTRDHNGQTCRGMNRMDRYVRSHGGRVDALYQYQGGGHGIFITGGPRRHSDALEAMFSYIRTI